jgi:hypothetical protein
MCQRADRYQASLPQGVGEPYSDWGLTEQLGTSGGVALRGASSDNAL